MRRTNALRPFSWHRRRASMATRSGKTCTRKAPGGMLTRSSEIGNGTEQGTRPHPVAEVSRDSSSFLSFNRYSTGTGHDPMEWLRYLSESEHSNEACTALRGFFNWLCSRRRDSAGRSYRPVRCKSTLSTILRYWLMVVRAEVGRRLDPDTVEALNMVRPSALFVT